ncbi:hypothetical protein [Marinifilum sp.]|uniref:hypothetical protein n=1 Tax=Marinifilum sp. TaxID=2033137 RepID=UPI003BAD87E5
MKTIHKRLLTLEGALLSLVGPVHIIYLIFFLEASTVDKAQYIGILVIGALYTLFGISFLLRKKTLLLPALIINALGLTAVLVLQEASPLWEIDPYLIAVDCVSVPMLLYFNIRKNKL